jgi:hypothetical protein
MEEVGCFLAVAEVKKMHHVCNEHERFSDSLGRSAPPATLLRMADRFGVFAFSFSFRRKLRSSRKDCIDLQESTPCHSGVGL